MSFTIKHRFYQPVESPADCTSGPGWQPVDTIMGPFSDVTASWQNDRQVVHGTYGNGDNPGVTYSAPGSDGGLYPSPSYKIWVMNEAGATVASYDL